MASSIVYDSTTQAQNGANSTITMGGFQAFSFTTGASGGSLSDVQVELFELSPDGGSITAYLYSNTAGSNTPGSQLATLGTVGDASLNAGPGASGLTLADFAGAPSTALAANTRYWIKLVSTSDSNVDVEFAAGSGGTGVATEFQQTQASPAGTSGSNATSGDSVQARITEAVCFAAGTRLRTETGWVAVEDLAVGERVVTASGRLRPITWLGARVLRGDGRLLPHGQQPVRIRRGAFGRDADGVAVPARDLRLSPGHPVLVGAGADGEGGHLVPVMCLINGTTVERMPVASITYWHVELDSHDILLAEGLPAESYLDGGDRAFFTEGADHALANPDFVAPGLAARCRPVAVDGPLVEAERRRLDAVFTASLAAHCAWSGEDRAFSS